jgi:hypothetical protein
MSRVPVNGVSGPRRLHPSMIWPASTDSPRPAPMRPWRWMP